MKSTAYHRFLGVVLVVIVAAVLFFTGLFNLGGGRTPYFSEAPVPKGVNWYVDLQWGMTEAHYHVLYRGFGPSIENARKADVLLLGDSRAMLGYDWRQIEAFAEAEGITLFNLGIDGGTGWEFPLEIMKRHGVKPKAVVILPDFISSPIFPAAKDALDGTLLSSFKYVLSSETLWRIKSTLDRYCPYLLKLFFQKNSNLATYRSTTNGCWFRDGWIDEPHYPVPIPDGSGDDKEIPSKLMSYLSASNIAVAVTYFASDNGTLTLGDRLAKRMGGEGIPIRVDGLSTYDQVHLDKAGSELYTKRFLEVFKQTNIYKSLVKAHSLH